MSDENKKPIKLSSLTLTSSVKPIGKKESRDYAVGQAFEERKVALTKRDRENHTHIIGSTGTGKSKFIELLIRQDITDRNCGLCLIDPHGSLYDEIVSYVAHTRPTLADRFILFNPAAEYEQIAGFNPIPADITHFDYTLSTLISACLKAWGQDNTDTTPRISRWLRNVFYPILAKRLTLLESAPLVDAYSKDEREALLSGIGNSLVIGDWLTFESLPLTQKQQQIEGAANRLQKFLSNEIIRNIIGQGSRALDFARIMNEGKIVLVNLSGGGKISYDNAQLLGIMMVNEIFRVAKLRDPRDVKLKPFYFYIDEFGQFITRDIARALEECRKYRLFMILAHQHLAQLKNDDEYLYASVLTNCKNKVVFGGLSKEDAEVMADEIVTGFVNLKAVKDETYATKVRAVEETRIVRGKSAGVTRGSNESESLTESESTGRTEGETVGQSRGLTQTRGDSLTRGTSETTGESIGRGTQRSVSDTRGKSTGITEGASETATEGWNRGSTKTDARGSSVGHSQSETTGKSHGRSQSDTLTHTEGSSESETHGESHSRTTQRGQTHTSGWSEMEGRSEGFSETQGATYGRSASMRSHNEGESRQSGYQQSTSRSGSSGTSFSEGETHGSSHSHTTGRNQSDSRGHTQGASETESQSRTAGQSLSEQQSHSQGLTEGTSGSRAIGRSQADTRTDSEAHTEGYGESETRTESRQRGTNETRGESTSRAESTQESHGTSRSASETRGTARSTAHGTSENRSEGESETVVPFLRPEEYTELTGRTFWTKEELHYMEMAAMKNQATGEAFIRVGSNAPVRVKVEHVKAAPYSRHLTPKRIDAFRQKVFEKNSRYYTPLGQVRLEYEERQRRIFGCPLRFDERPLLSEGAIDIEARRIEEDEQDPFG
jgi:hypothetical protein